MCLVNEDSSAVELPRGVKYEEIMHRNLWNLIFVLYEFIQEDLLRTVHFQSKLLHLPLSEAENRMFFSGYLREL